MRPRPLTTSAQEATFPKLLCAFAGKNISPRRSQYKGMCLKIYNLFLTYIPSLFNVKMIYETAGNNQS